jgi:hypothetical protein
MKKMLKRVDGEQSKLYHFVDGVCVNGKNDNMSGNCSRLSGNCSGLSGNCSGLSGDCSGLSGNCSGLYGNLDECEIDELTNIQDLVQQTETK